MRVCFLVVAMALALGGCRIFGHYVGPGENEIRDTGWLPSEVPNSGERVYCYRTLGEVDCHPVALDQREKDARLVNYFEPNVHPKPLPKKK